MILQAEWLGQKTAQVLSGKTGLFREVKFLPPSPGLPRLHRVRVESADLSVFGGRAFSCSGAGFAPEKALARALGEGFERYAASIPVSESRVFRRSISDLKSANTRFLHPHTFNVWTAFQYRIPTFRIKPPSSDTNLLWTTGMNLTSGEPFLIPLDLCIFRKPQAPSYDLTTSGLASEESLENATLNALLELIERDSLMRHWWLKKPFKKIYLEEGQELLRSRLGYLSEFISFYHGENLFNLPCIFARWRKPDDPSVAFLLAGACDLNIEKAIDRALCELLLHLASRWARAEPARSMGQEFDREILSFQDHRDFYLYEANAKTIDSYFSGSDQVEGQTFSESRICGLNDLVRQLEIAGKNAYVVDLTPRELKALGIRCVRVLSPDFVPINSAHVYRPWGHPAIGGPVTFELENLQHLPHPFP